MSCEDEKQRKDFPKCLDCMKKENSNNNTIGIPVILSENLALSEGESGSLGSFWKGNLHPPEN